MPDSLVDSYTARHRHPLNRLSHAIGIPMIAVSLPLFFFSWRSALGLFIVGWIFQFVGHAIEGNQPSLSGSGERVAGIVGAIAERLDLDQTARDDLYVAALLRDIGELGIDRRVLDTPGELSEEQRELVHRHPLLGETILAALAFLGDASRIVRAHHECWDGSGYPDQLAAEEIPLGARILRAADAFVAMTSERPYRAALRPAEAMGALISSRGQAFDPRVVDAFVAVNASGEPRAAL